MNRAQLDSLLDETILEVTSLNKKEKDRLIDALVEVLTSEVGVELDEEEVDEDVDG